jgi:hypothetical protein
VPGHGHELGFALVWLVVTLLGLLLFAGLVLDAGRAYVVKTQLTKAVDGAALAAARALNSGDPEAEARSIFRANFPPEYLGTTDADPTSAADFYALSTNEAAGTNVVQIRASTVLNTTFMSLAAIPTVNVGSFGEATRRMVDLCLVLDESSSIGWRWPYVRDAARAFVRAFDEVTDRFCLVEYSSGANATAPIRTAGRGFDKDDIVDEIPETIPSEGYTSMAEGLWRGWDELRAVPRAQQSSLRVIVLFTDGAANGVPGIYSGTSVRSLNTSDFPEHPPDPDNMTSNTPSLRGMFHTQTGVRNPQASQNWNWAGTNTHAIAPLLPLTSTHAHGRAGVGTPTTYPLFSDTLKVNGVVQSHASRRKLLGTPTGGRYPAHIRNTNNAARNLVEIIADAIRADTSGAYRIRIYTIGMGELLRYNIGTMPEKPEDIMLRVANDIDSLDYNAAQVQGKYYYAQTEADVSTAFQELQNQIIRLSK